MLEQTEPAQPKAAPQSQTVLLVEDDVRMQKVLRRVFIEQGYAVVSALDGLSAVREFQSCDPTAVVLDLMLPHMGGRELCKRFKTMSAETPVIILSAISEVADKVLLLEIGADDYVTKPFSPRELMARVQAAIRRQKRTPTPAPLKIHTFGDCEINFLKMSATRGNENVFLTAHEFKLLRFFIEHAEQVLSREALLNEVWGYHSYPTTRTVDNQILKLRQKLEKDPANPVHLLTIYGAGYKFVP